MNSLHNNQHCEGDVEETNLNNENESVLIHVVPECKSRWNHIEDLDSFFSRVYYYHQQHGFMCMMLQEFLQLLQFGFVVIFTIFLSKCVNYKVLFRNEPFAHQGTNGTKITLLDVIYERGECVSSFGPGIWGCLFVALTCWILRCVGVVYHFFQYSEIRSFYRTALHIDDNDLDNMTWHEVQQRLRRAQQEFQMCIHKSELTELDIYHRILRFKNYIVAMVNKSILPVKFNFPLLGETVVLTRGLKYNIEFLLFWGPWAAFDASWHLREDFKLPTRRREQAKQLEKYIGYLGILNLILAPLILVWQLLYAFFSYAELVKREPGTLGTRRWSLYGKMYFRHFNELDHELQARLSRAYRPATHYLAGFSSNIASILARNLAFVAGAVLAVLIILTVYDEDVITVEHVLTIMTILGAVVAACRVLIPEENFVWCPETLMEAILAQVHYIPLEWKGKAHTAQVRSDLSELFQYKAVYLLEELISPVVTPFILYFILRPRAQLIVDFLRQFTVEVVGVGDVCSFAQLDLQKHGQPQWQSSVSSKYTDELPLSKESNEEENTLIQAEGGKTELSLIHFALTNPDWRPPRAAEGFLTALKCQLQQELLTSHALPNILTFSSGPNSSVLHSVLRPSLLTSMSTNPLPFNRNLSFGRGVVKSEGPRTLPENRAFINESTTACSTACSESSSWDGVIAAEPVATNMTISTLYLHDLQHRRSHIHRSARVEQPMPGIRESLDEETYSNPVADATDALTIAVSNLSNNSRMRLN